MLEVMSPFQIRTTKKLERLHSHMICALVLIQALRVKIFFIPDFVREIWTQLLGKVKVLRDH